MSTVLYEWVPQPLPTEMPFTQVSGFCFNKQGQILLTKDNGEFGIPGGKPEPGETSEETLVREVLEEVQCEINSLVYLGYQLVTGDPYKFGGAPYAQLRYACRVITMLPQQADVATGRVIDREYAIPERAAQLIGWGEDGRQKIACACATLGFPSPRPA